MGEWVEHVRHGVCRVVTLTGRYVFVEDMSGMSHRVLWGDLDAVCFGFDVLRSIGFEWVDRDMGILRIEEPECYVYADVGRDVSRCRIEMKRGHQSEKVWQWELRCRRLHDMQRWYYRNMGEEMRFVVRVR